MSVNIGSAIGYLDLDIKGFRNGIKVATQQLDIFNNNTATSGQKIKALSGAMNDIGSNLTKFISVPLLGIGALSIKTAGDFEAGMSKVSALSGATGSDLKMLENKAKEMGATTKFSATEASDALSYMALAGWDAEQMASGLEPALKLAGAAGMDLALTTDIVTDTMSMFGMKATEATKMTDMLAYAQSNSNTDVQQLGEALKYCGASANAMGYDLADTTALLGTFADQGLKGSSAGTTLNAMFRDMKKGAEDGAIAIGKTKVPIVDATGNYRDMTDILSDVDKATQGMTTAQKDQALSSVWGTEALKGINMAFEAGIPKIREFEDGIRSSDGTANEMYDTMQNNLKGSIDNLKSAFEGACIVIGENLIPMFQGIVEWLTDALTWFNNLDEGTQTIIVSIGVLVASLGPLLKLGGSIIDMLPDMVQGFKLARLAVIAFQSSALAVPLAIGLIISACIGLATWIGGSSDAIALLQDKFGTLGYIIGVTCEIINGLVQLTFGNMIIIIKTAAQAIMAIFKGQFWKLDDIAREGWAKVENNTAEAMSDILGETTEGISLIKTKTESELKNVTNVFDKAMKELPKLTKDNAGNIAKVFTEEISNLDQDSLTILRGTSDSMAVLFEGIRQDMDTESATKKFTANLESMAVSGKYDMETLQSDIDKAMETITSNMLVESEEFKQSATDVFNEFKTVGSQGIESMASNVAGILDGMNVETKNQLSSMGDTWNKILSGVATDGSMSTTQMKDIIISNFNNMGIDGAKLISQLRTESSNHMKAMADDANKNSKDLEKAIDEGTKSAKEKASNNTKDLAINVDKNIKNAKENVSVNTKVLAIDTDTNTKQAASSAKNNTAEGAKSVEQNMSKMAKDAKLNTSKVATETDMDFKKANISIQQEATNMYNGAKLSFTKLAEIAKQAGTDMYNGVTNSASKMASNAKQSASDMYNGVTTSTRLMADSAISDWNRIRDAYSVPITGKINITKTTTELNIQKETSTLLSKGIFDKDVYKKVILANENLNTAFYSGQIANEVTTSSIKKEIILKLKDNSKSKEKEFRNKEKKIVINNTYNSPKPTSIRELKKQDEIQMRRLAMQLKF